MCDENPRTHEIKYEESSGKSSPSSSSRPESREGRRRFRFREIDAPRLDSSILNTLERTDMEHLAVPPLIPSHKSRKKDKSAARKSHLNASLGELSGNHAPDVKYLSLWVNELLF